MITHVQYGVTNSFPTVMEAMTQITEMIDEIVGIGKPGGLTTVSHSVTPVGKKFVGSVYFTWVDRP